MRVRIQPYPLKTIKWTTKKLNTLVKCINNFDTYFEMLDSNDIYEKGIIEQTNITMEVEKLSIEEKDYLLKSLTEYGNNNLERYF